MKRIALIVVLAVSVTGIGIGLLLTPRAHAQGPIDVITSGCDIPKSYGRLVSILPGQSGGPHAGTTYAVFEAEDGTVRWVATMPSGTVANTQSIRGQITPAFIAKYECMLGSEWKRH